MSQIQSKIPDHKHMQTLESNRTGKDTGSSNRAPDQPSEWTAEDVKKYGKLIRENCQKCFKRMNECTTEESCQRESMALTYCMASIVCPKETANFDKDPSSDVALDEMTFCLQEFEKKAYEFS